jgi:signal transduction histidine kinase
MSRSITTRLILAFLLVGITVVALASGITYWLTVSEFKQLTFNQARDRFVADITYYYQTQGSWDGVLTYYQARNRAISPFTAPPNPPGPEPPGGQPRPQTFFFALAGQDGRILIPAGAYEVGELVPAAALSRGTPITVNEARVGTALVIGSPPPLGALETGYLNGTYLALLYAALGGAALALLLGAVLARALTHPIRDLTAAIRRTAGGDLGQRVVIKSKDELGELAAAFNQMSSDLAQALRSRRRMTADIAHDLRNPLTVIGGYIESMREGVLKPTLGRLEAIQNEVRHLERLVDDLRTLSQAEAGELSLNRESIEPLALLDRTVRSYRPLADKQGITLRSQAEARLPEIHVDPDRLAQVLENLITNSLRYTSPRGEILLGAWRDADSVILTVTDNGKGIAPDALPHVFDRFYRADSARTRADESGLGLAIGKSIIEAHGGTIDAESSQGAGTTITIRLPIGGGTAASCQ